MPPCGIFLYVCVRLQECNGLESHPATPLQGCNELESHPTTPLQGCNGLESHPATPLQGCNELESHPATPLQGCNGKILILTKILITTENQTQLNFSWLAELTNPHHDGTTQQIYDFAHAYQTGNSGGAPGDTPGTNPGTIIDGADEG